jgi:hypothetical protein
MTVAAVTVTENENATRLGQRQAEWTPTPASKDVLVSES